MLLSKYPWWAFALVTVMLLNPFALLGFISTLMILDTILALQRRFTYVVCAELWRLSFGVIRVN